MRGFFVPLSRDDSGFGLVSALLFVLLIAAAVAPLAIAGRVHTLSTAYAHERREFEVLADGLARTLYALDAAGKVPSRWLRCETPRYVFHVDIQDQNGLIDLNSASPQLLEFGFRALGFDENSAFAAGRLVGRFRASGPSDADGIDGSSIDLKHAPFEDVTELADVVHTLSMRHVPRIFTVFNKTDTVALQHVDGRLRQIIEEGRGSEFLAEGIANSSVSEVTITRFRKGRASGFMFKAMMRRGADMGEAPHMIRRAVSVIEEGDTIIPAQTASCAGVAELLVRSYET